MWWNGIPSSVESFSALRLDGRTWLYFQHTDSEDDFLYLLAVAETNSARETQERFMTELFRSNGETFGAEFLVSPPSEVTSTFSRSFLADCFVLAADVAICDDFRQEVQDVINRSRPNSLASKVDFEKRAGRVQLMERYLAVVLKRR